MSLRISPAAADLPKQQLAETSLLLGSVEGIGPDFNEWARTAVLQGAFKDEVPWARAMPCLVTCFSC